ncbi:protein CCSMST1 [Astyanax mexicanus]|uniref:Protein CCSMST1 n=1 Tax=Astyanax mexicanus TaxID=7994 RepID=A0A8T2LWV1_ASTMX|nr:protein CCSMST1 [Astyanax mexicanus]
MASAFWRTFTKITGFSTRPGSSALQCIRPCTVRALSVTSHCSAKSKGSSGSNENNEVNSEPIKFSTSKGSHRTWRVERSMGSTHQRPWWKVLPFSIMCVSFVLWCFLRKESDVDKALEKQLYEHLPGLLTTMGIEEEDDEEEKTQTEAKKKEP